MTTRREQLIERRLELMRELHNVEDSIINYDNTLFVNGDKPFSQWTLQEMQNLVRINLDAYRWFTDTETPENGHRTIKDYNASHLVKVRFDGDNYA